MTLEEFIKKLGIALQDEDTAKGLESFGIEPEQLEGFKDLTIPTTLNEALKIKGVQSEYDQRLAKAADTREAKLKLKYGFGEEEEEQPEEEEVKTDNPEIKKLLNEISEMKKWREEQEQEKKTQTVEQKRAAFTKNLKEKGIPAVYVHELDLEKDFDEQLETVSKRFEEDGGSFSQKTTKLPFTKRGETKNEPSKEEIEAFKRKI